MITYVTTTTDPWLTDIVYIYTEYRTDYTYESI